VTLYDTLGVSPRASAADVRDAYRRLARQHHPDRGGRDAAAMAAVNEAYRVLGDPARRAVYDRWLRAPVGSATPASAQPSPARVAPEPSPRPPTPLPPARYPWKLVAGMFLLGVTVVLIGAALYEPAAEPPPDNLIGPGSCVVIEGNGDAREVNCGDGGEQLVVEALVPIDAQCPTGTAGYRDRQGRGLACVRSPAEESGGDDL
jgi:molecular chaperone DnaJ